MKETKSPFYDTLDKTEWRLYVRLLGLADEFGKIKETLRVLASKLKWVEDRYGTRGAATEMTVVRILNSLADRGIIELSDEKTEERSSRNKHKNFAMPIQLRRGYQILAPTRFGVLDKYKNENSTLKENRKVIEERNAALRKENRELRAYKEFQVEQNAADENPFAQLGGDKAQGKRFKLILAWLVLIDIDEYFYDPHNKPEKGLIPTFTLFQKWIAITGFPVVLAVLQELYPHNIKERIGGQHEDWKKSRDAVRAYVTGAMKKGKERGISSTKRYARENAGGEDDQQAFV